MIGSAPHEGRERDLPGIPHERAQLALRQLERAYRRSVRFALRTERRDPLLAARAYREADDIARVIEQYRVLISLGADVQTVETSPEPRPTSPAPVGSAGSDSASDPDADE